MFQLHSSKEAFLSPPLWLGMQVNKHFNTHLMDLSSLCTACTLTCVPYKTIICFYDYCVFVLQLYWVKCFKCQFSLYIARLEIDIKPFKFLCNQCLKLFIEKKSSIQFFSSNVTLSTTLHFLMRLLNSC